MVTFATETKRNKAGGQSLVEMVLAVGIIMILIVPITTAITLVVQQSINIKSVQTADSLTQEYLSTIRALSEADWHTIYDVSGKGASSQFYLAPSSSTYTAEAGTTSTTVEGESLTRYFSVENVNRDFCGVGSITTNPISSPACAMQDGTSYVAEDPSTQKITVYVEREEGQKLSRTEYLTRSRNQAFIQTDWSGGFDQEYFPAGVPTSIVNDRFSSSSKITYASSTGAMYLDLNQF